MLWTLLSLVLRIKISQVQTPDHNLIGGGRSYRNVAQLSFIDFVLQKEGLVRIACRRRSIGWYCFDSRLVLWSCRKTSRSMSYVKHRQHTSIICNPYPYTITAFIKPSQRYLHHRRNAPHDLSVNASQSAIYFSRALIAVLM